LETEGLIGFFVNTLVLRTEVSGTESFRELLKRVREVALAAYSHQEVPFEKLVEELQPERELSRSPLFQVMFVLQNASKQDFELSGVELSSIGTGNTAAKFDLTLSLLDTREGLVGALEYNSDLFHASTMRRMAGCYEQLLKSAVADAEQQVSKMRLLPEGEREQVLERWNQTRREYELAGSSLHELVEAQVERTPAAVAVVYGQEQLSYGELNERANQLAHYLQRAGVGAESLVGILLERSVEMVVALLAVLKAGAAYVPLDPAYPQERLSFMLEETGTTVLLTQQALVQQLPAHQAQLLCLDTQWAKVAGESKQNPESDVRGDNLAYVIYTSGSSGRPKAVMNSHRGIVNRLLWMQEQYQLRGSDRILQKTPYSFDVSVWEFFWPLLAGARLVVARPEGHRDREYLVELIAAEQVTVLHFVPSMLKVFLEAAEVAAGCGSVRQVICSGEELTGELAGRCLERLGGELDNLYGPTEAAVDVTVWRCERGRAGGAVAIGRPIANLELYILDGEGEPVPVGVRGELHIGGAGLARGYLQRPELTAERFIPHPFSREGGARLYRTGDLARYKADGNIEYLGRADTQVKVRGYRIELGEIEVVLARHAGVRQCAVIVREDGGAEKQLVAYVVAGEGASLEVSELRRSLREQLPDYMIPAAFVLLDELPLTASGKLDRRALPAHDSTRPQLENIFIAPRTPVEAELSAIWCELLQLHQVSINDNFFELGGHSLLLTQFVSRVRHAYQVELPLRMLFDAPNIEDMTMLLATRQIEQEDRTIVLKMLEELGQLSVAEVQVQLEAETLNNFPMHTLAF
jgi:amino acid adenylation domain-containing protein